MTAENPRFRPKEIKAEDLTRQQQNIQEMAGSLLGRMQGNFPVDLVGGLLFGAPTKKETTSDGKQQEKPWNMTDIMQQFDEMGRQDEVSVRREMTVDIITAIQVQTNFFDKNEHPLRARALDIAELSVTLLQSVVSSKEETAASYPVWIEESYWQAELLEVMRRTILKPTQILLEGYGRRGINSVSKYSNDGFWAAAKSLVTEEMNQAFEKSNMEEYNRLERARIKKGLEDRSEKNWENLIRKEENFLLDHLKRSLRRKIKRSEEEISLAEQLTYEGELVFPEEFIEGEKKALNTLQEADKEFGDIRSFADVRPWIQNKFGKDATFQTFLDFVNPKEQKQENV